MAIKPLNDHYSFTGSPSIHDEEAMTALELAGRTAQKVNEAVKAFNEHEEKTVEHLTKQDAAIEKMNDVTMPGKVAEEVDRHIESGDFDEAIDKYAGGLEARVDNLIGNIAPGSTASAMDAEIIDGRVNVNGIAYRSLGEALRTAETINQLRMTDTSILTYEPVEKTTFNGYYDTTGKYYELDSARTYEVNVNPGEVYIYDIVYGYDLVDAVLFDASGKFIRYYNHLPEKTTHTDKTFTIVIPNGAAKLCVNTYALKTVGGVHYWGDVYKVTGSRINDTDLIDYVNKRFSMIDMKPVLGEDVPGEVTENSFIYAESETVDSINGDIYFTKACPVTPGELLYVEGSASYKNFVYTFYANGIPLGVNFRNAENDNQIVFRGEINVPNGADMLYIASEKNAAPVVKYISVYSTGGNVGEFAGLKWCVMGDSLTEHNIRALKNYHDYIAEKTGITVINLGLSGSGYMKRQDEEKAFYQLVDSIPEDVDCITIFGSGNDIGLDEGYCDGPENTNTICGCVHLTITKIRERFPLVPLGIVSPTPWDSYNPRVDRYNLMASYTDSLEGVCELRGIPFLDLYRCSGLLPWDESFREVAYTRDPDGVGCHPDENGHKMIAPRFYAFLKSLIGTY